MKHFGILTMCAMALLFGVVTAVSAAEEPAKSPEAKSTETKQPEMTPEQVAEMEAWMKAGQPGPQHARFKKMVGDWKVENKMFQEGSEATTTEATSTFSLMFGGRYLKEEYRGDWAGMPFEGFSLTGYDNVAGKHVMLWIDSMSTSITTLEGDYDEKTRTLTAVGSFLDPQGTKMKMRTVSREIDDDKYVMEMFMITPDGKEMKNMEMTYTRQ